jgi:hypothetical protein
MRTGRMISLAFAGFLALVSIAPGRAVAEDPPYAEGSAPVYLIISFDDTFVTGVHASQMIVVNVGTFVGGDGILDTRFAVNESLNEIVLPDGRRDPSFEELQTNAATLFGSFMTGDLAEVHMVTPAPGEIPPEIQDAVFRAGHEGRIDALLLEEPFPTTTEVAEVVVDALPPGAPYGLSQVQTYLFGSAPTLSAGSDGSAGGEGEMFPHQPNSPSLFHYSVKFFSDGAFASDFRLRVGFDVHPGSKTNPVNFKNKGGEVPAAILTEPDFDASTIVLSTVNIGGVAPSKTDLKDMDGDGDDDLYCHWTVGDLVSGGAATSATTSLTFRADLSDGSGIIGTDLVNVK